MPLLKPQGGTKSLLVPTAVSAPFWAGCLRGELLYQRCTECGLANFIPGAACRFCLSRHIVWEESRGLATLYSFSIVWRPLNSDFTPPYAPALVDLDEGYQMLTSIIGCTSEELAVGMHLRVKFIQASPDIHLPYFVPA